MYYLVRVWHGARFGSELGSSCYGRPSLNSLQVAIILSLVANGLLFSMTVRQIQVCN